ncbi:alpha/beta hydrolase [Jejuia pallidilutea]|uniref:alpha/beta hydrolase n=1 Tax=Jejuia pallidilutea TaxID=504487 RepID=UPI001FD0851F|nr:alpha/beta hydrolase [Jejuia pallidilutea]
MKTKFTIYLCFIITYFGYAQNKDYTEIKGIKYYQDTVLSQDVYANKMCVLDIYYPLKKTNAPAVIWFHGGGLSGGDKFIPNALKEKGLIIISVNYRLHPRVKNPTYIQDAAAAVAWAFKHIETYNGNKKSIFISGHSAGGYLASMIALDKKWLKKHNIDANTIAGVAPFSGHTITHFTIRKEQGIDGTQPIIDEFAPLYHVRKDAPPFLLITGDREKEMLGRYEENAYLMRMMQVVGHKNTVLFELNGYDHGGMAQPAFQLLINFINKVNYESRE